MRQLYSFQTPNQSPSPFAGVLMMLVGVLAAMTIGGFVLLVGLAALVLGAVGGGVRWLLGWMRSLTGPGGPRNRSERPGLDPEAIRPEAAESAVPPTTIQMERDASGQWRRGA